jgi:hypothetical protein
MRCPVSCRQLDRLPIGTARLCNRVPAGVVRVHVLAVYMYRRKVTKSVHTHHVLPFAVYIGSEHGLLFDLLVRKTLFAVLLVFPTGPGWPQPKLETPSLCSQAFRTCRINTYNVHCLNHCVSHTGRCYQCDGRVALTNQGVIIQLCKPSTVLKNPSPSAIPLSPPPSNPIAPTSSS